MTAVHLLTGEYPPDAGGVGDYTRLVAGSLAARGCEVHVWSPGLAASRTEGSIHLHRLPDGFGPASRLALEAALDAAPGRVLLQYVPNALGARGANLRFCLWLRAAGRRTDVRVMFHEPYFYFAWQHPLRNALAAVQRLMAAVLLRAGPVAYLSTDSWRRSLAPWAPSGTCFVVSPVPSTVLFRAEPGAIERWRALFVGGSRTATLVGHFGTYGDHMARELNAVVPAILRRDAGVRIVCLGRGSDEFASGLPAEWRPRVIGTGALAPEDLAAALRACDLLVQPYPDGVTTRRTSVMAGLANGVAVVTTTGALTEPIWHESQAVGLAGAGRPDAIAAAVITLLCDPRERGALAERGRRTYDESFALARTVGALLQAPAEPVFHSDRARA